MAHVLDYGDVVRALQVRLIQTPLSVARTLSPEDDAPAAAEMLHSENYDQAPVMIGPRVIGVASRDALATTSTVREAIRDLSDGLLISADTPLAEVPQLLVAEPFRFVLDGAAISGFVTPWDLNKQAARAHLYLLLADLEMSLAALLRRRYRRDQRAMLDLLEEHRAKRIWGRFRRAQRQDRESDVAALLDFEDLLQIAGADEYLRTRLGRDSSANWQESVDGLGATRQGVMHLTGELVGGRLKLENLVDIERRVRTLTASINGVRRVAPFRVNRDESALTQRVTAADIEAGRIRLPRTAKTLLPSSKAKLDIRLRGRHMRASYDPRLGPDRERSGVLSFGRRILEGMVRPDERLRLATRRGLIRLD